MSAAVSLSNVTKRYRRGKESVEVIRNLDLTIESGEFVAIMGPSGSGKSTLLNLIGGLDRPDEGRVLVGGEEVNKLSNSQLARWRSRHIGFVFQFYNLMPTLSAERNVELPLLLTRLSAARRRKMVATVLEIVGLTDRAKHKPNELSGGQQQRVGIARALVTDASILVCDEPTGDLDRTTADEVLDLLRFLSHERGKTVIMVTHDVRAAEYASRRLHVDKGVLLKPPANQPAEALPRVVSRQTATVG